MISTVNENKVVNSIILTYNKDVQLVTTVGFFTAKYVDMNNNVQTYPIKYTAAVDKNVVKVIIDPTTLIGTGSYIVTIPAYFVTDVYMNYNEQEMITLKSSAATGSKLPAPTKITQDATNPSLFYVEFGTKVDLTTAGAVSSYRIDTKYPASAEVLTNSTSGAVVKISFANGDIPITSKLPFYVQNICGDNGTYQVMDNYITMINVVENRQPVLTSATISGTTITLKFSENVQGNADFKVYNYGTEIPLNSGNSCYIVNDTVMIFLSQTVSGNYVTVQPTAKCSIKDAAGNPALMSNIITVNFY